MKFLLSSTEIRTELSTSLVTSTQLSQSGFPINFAFELRMREGRTGPPSQAACCAGPATTGSTLMFRRLFVRSDFVYYCGLSVSRYKAATNAGRQDWSSI
jgi:hypothetical protein